MYLNEVGGTRGKHCCKGDPVGSSSNRRGCTIRVSDGCLHECCERPCQCSRKVMAAQSSEWPKSAVENFVERCYQSCYHPAQNSIDLRVAICIMSLKYKDQYQ